LVGAIRQATDVAEALEDGAHVVAVPPPVLRKMLWNPSTESTIRKFNQAWKERDE
jgi:transaldolase